MRRACSTARNIGHALDGAASRSRTSVGIRSIHLRVARERLHVAKGCQRTWLSRSVFRSFTSSRLVSAPSSPPLKDPSHPNLYYHLVAQTHGEADPTHALTSRFFALSFLEERPPHEGDSATVLGWLPAEAFGEDEESGLNDFVENPRFLRVLHGAVQDALLNDDIWVNGATQTQSGWMHIFDQRNPPPLGRIPDPDDIIASVRVEDATLMPETYEAMPSYRVCTGEGVCLLTERTMDVLRQRLREVAKAEREG